jgi:P27 family predicted phage terminase small subunit
MPGGRPPKPTNLIKANGTFKKHRHADRLELPSATPTMPFVSGDVATQTFAHLSERLSRLGVLSDLDGYALQMLADAWEDYTAARDVVRRLGATYETITEAGQVMIRPRPEVAMYQNAWDRMKKIIGEFGLTPSSRAKLGKKDEVQDVDDMFA